MVNQDLPFTAKVASVFWGIGYFSQNGVCAYEKNCDYWDPNKKDRTSILDCQNSGCCGTFRERHCCRGPIVPVAVTFAVVIVIIIIVVITLICYDKYKHQKRRKTQTLPETQKDEIPVPSPVRRIPPMYNTPRTNQPTFTPQPFRTPNHFLEQEQHPPPSFLHPPSFVITKAK